MDKTTAQKQKATSNKSIYNYRVKSFICGLLFFEWEGYCNTWVRRGWFIQEFSFHFHLFISIWYSITLFSASSTLCKRKVIAYLLLNDSVMVYYIINHLSVVSKHTQWDCDISVGYKFGQKQVWNLPGSRQYLIRGPVKRQACASESKIKSSQIQQRKPLKETSRL